ncbi:MAG: hypothetical protein ACFFDY_09220 [Candidatus Thorarchaeota archaeon]
MKNRIILILFISIIEGLVITYITGFFIYPMNGLIGCARWGFPFYWITQVIVPGAEKVINWTNFIINTMFWGFIVFIANYLIVYLSFKYKNRKENKKS